MKKSKSKHLKSVWLVTVPVAACAVAFLALVFIPSMKKLRTKHDELALNRAYIAQANEAALQLNLLEDEVAAAEAYLTRVQANLPSEESLASLYASLNEQCIAADVTVNRFEPVAPENYGLLKQIPVRLSTSGTYDETIKLLAALDTLHGAVWVEDLRLAFGPKAGGAAGCDLNLAVFANRSGNSD